MATNLLAGGADANVIMAQGGWSSQEAMSAYLKVDPALARKTYDTAKRRHREMRATGPKTRTIDLNEYLMRSQNKRK